MRCRTLPVAAVVAILAFAGSVAALPLTDVLDQSASVTAGNTYRAPEGWTPFIEETAASAGLDPAVANSPAPLLPDEGAGTPLREAPAIYAFTDPGTTEAQVDGAKTYEAEVPVGLPGSGVSAAAGDHKKVTSVASVGGFYTPTASSDLTYYPAMPMMATNGLGKSYTGTTRLDEMAAPVTDKVESLLQPIKVNPLVLSPQNTETQSATTVSPGGAGPLEATPAQAAAAAAALGVLGFVPWALYHRITGNRTLANATRKRIYESVCARPGIGVRDTAASAGVSYSTAIYHLDRLVKERMLVLTGEGSKLRYYKNGGSFSETDRALMPVLKNKEALRVLAHVRSHPETYRAAIAESLGVTPTTVNWHLKRLLETGLITERREGRSAFLSANESRVASDLIPLAAKVESPAAATMITQMTAAPIAA